MSRDQTGTELQRGTLKVMVSLPQELLTALDAAARVRSMSRSGLVREAIRRYLAQGPSPSRGAAIQRLRRTFRSLPTSAEIVRAERDR
jgi:hypothetical protein